MILSEILKEKNRVQIKLSKENSSIDKYLKSSHAAAKKAAKKYGFNLKYAQISKK